MWKKIQISKSAKELGVGKIEEKKIGMLNTMKKNAD